MNKKPYFYTKIWRRLSAVRFATSPYHNIYKYMKKAFYFSNLSGHARGSIPRKSYFNNFMYINLHKLVLVLVILPLRTYLRC